MSTVERFRTAVERRDLTTMEALFTPDVRFFSPVKFTPFEGRPMTLGLLGILLDTFQKFRYVGRLDGTAETHRSGAETESHVLVFRATVNGKHIHGIDLLQVDEQGLIKEFTVMVRPQSAVTALSEAVYAGLAAAGIVPNVS